MNAAYRIIPWVIVALWALTCWRVIDLQHALQHCNTVRSWEQSVLLCTDNVLIIEDTGDVE